MGDLSFLSRLGGFLFVLVFPTFTPKHTEACLIQYYAMDLFKNPLSVGHPIFLMQYIHLYIVCVKFDRKVYLLHCKYM